MPYVGEILLNELLEYVCGQCREKLTIKDPRYVGSGSSSCFAAKCFITAVTDCPVFWRTRDRNRKKEGGKQKKWEINKQTKTNKTNENGELN
jgi:hypothetical protein